MVIDSPAAWIAGYFVVGGVVAGTLAWPEQSGSSVIWIVLLWPVFVAIFIGMLIRGLFS